MTFILLLVMLIMLIVMILLARTWLWFGLASTARSSVAQGGRQWC